jgi:hypothetical protein
VAARKATLKITCPYSSLIAFFHGIRNEQFTTILPFETCNSAVEKVVLDTLKQNKLSMDGEMLSLFSNHFLLRTLQGIE